MELRHALHTRSRTARFRAVPLDPARLQQVLEAAAGTPSFADQSPIRLLCLTDDASKSALRRACERLRGRWFAESAYWTLQALQHGGEHPDLEVLTEAPVVLCIFGEVEKPFWREAAWSAVERLRLAAFDQGWSAASVRLEALGFLNALLGVPPAFAGAAILALGEPESSSHTEITEPDLQSLLLPYEPSPERLEHWNDPVHLGRFESQREQRERPFISDKQLFLGLLETASALHASPDADTILALAARELKRFFRYDRASVAWFEPVDGQLYLRDLHRDHGLPYGERREIPLSEENAIGWVMLNKSGLCRDDIAAEEAFPERLTDESLRSDMLAPLVANGRVLGTLCVGSLRAHAFTQGDFEILRGFCKVVGAAVEKSNLYFEAQRLAVFDGTTGLYNHRHFQVRLRQEIARSQRHGLSCGLLLANIDHFRVLNGSFGHELGDTVLASLAQTLRENLRETDLVARYGGEEFAILVPETHSEALHSLGDRLRRAAEERVHAVHGNVAVRATLSIGGCAQEPRDLNCEALIAQADAALYRAKCLGRNRLCLHGPAAVASRQPAQ